jgi:hypothetical protein
LIFVMKTCCVFLEVGTVLLNVVMRSLRDAYEMKPRGADRGEPGSSVSIVSGYGLDDQTIEVRSPAQAKGFFL